MRDSNSPVVPLGHGFSSSDNAGDPNSGPGRPLENVRH
jgi:hypothetical protein